MVPSDFVMTNRRVKNVNKTSVSTDFPTNGSISVGREARFEVFMARSVFARRPSSKISQTENVFKQLERCGPEKNSFFIH